MGMRIFAAGVVIAFGAARQLALDVESTDLPELKSVV